MGIEDRDIVLLFAGKFEQKKNPFYLLKVLENNLNERIKVLFVGNGNLVEKLKAAAQNDKRVLFLDFQNQLQMPVVYRMADLLILPSTGPGETWGLALNEAMACGIAVAASSKVGGAIDLIRPQQNGVIINLGNTKEIDQLLERALFDETVLRQMGKESLKLIMQYNFTKVIASIEKTILE